MDTASVFSDGRSSRDLKKYHEGWVGHQAANSKSWSKYWMVLRANMIFIFSNDRTTRENMVGSLTLNDNTEVDRATADKKKGPYKFELITASTRGDRRINKFKFDKENDCDLWKSFIIGITVGIVPSDVHLLPGQLKDVHEAIAEVRNRPPPVPSAAERIGIPRPKVIGQPRVVDDGGHGGTMNFGIEESHTSDDASSGSGSFGSHVTHMRRGPSVASAVASPGGASSGGGTINNLRELRKRQDELTNRILDVTTTNLPSTRRPSYPEEREVPRPSYHEEREVSRPTYQEQTRRPSLYPEDVEPEPSISLRRTLGPSGGADLFPQLPAETISQDSGFEQLDKQEDYSFSQNNNNNSTHLFYLDPERNRDGPAWFFEECQRDEAEQLLTVGRKFGNVLMRPSSTFVHTGKYVISMRREVAGGTNLNHYEVMRTADGFKINVDNQHSSMRCLSDVMDFFVSVAGPGTHPLRTNDRSKIYQSTIRIANTSTSPNVMSPKRENSNPSFGFENNIASPGWTQTQGGAPRDNGEWGGAQAHESPAMNRQTSTGDANWSFGPPSAGGTGARGRQDTYRDGYGYGSAQPPPAPPPAPVAPPPPPPPPPGAGLQVQGNVSGQIAQAVEEMNQSYAPRSPMSRNQQQSMYGQRQNSNPYGEDYGTRDRYGGLSAAVPARNTPMETLQRQAGHVDDITGGMQRMNTGYDGVPAGPPPPPPGRVTAYGRPSSPTYTNYAASQPGFSYLPPQQPTSPAGFPTSPPGGAKATSRFNEQPSFENELKNRLVRQREEIYASGAQVLRSNFN